VGWYPLKFVTLLDRISKRTFDLAVSAVGLVLLWPLILGSVLLARADTGASGIFKQQRIGRGGKVFMVYKVRSMRENSGSSVTVEGDPRVTRVGARLRQYKLDELPQLWNVLVGDMSFVGPRPDVVGFADDLSGESRQILKLRPGITGPATLKYRNEAKILATHPNPDAHNREVIWPDKVAINLEYFENYSFITDVKIIFKTVLGR
jgi:lipopolysaccharide/colanic/teichoic acid biosynthesis glycosyltransferase